MLRNVANKRIVFASEHYMFNVSQKKSRPSYIFQANRRNSDALNMASPWKEASTLIISAKSPLHESMGTNLGDLLARHAKTNVDMEKTYDYRLLMVKRNANSSFVANAYVFPGGTAELSDYSFKWWDVFNKAGFTNKAVMQLPKSIHGSRPPMFTASVTLANANLAAKDCFPPELALRICAIRETFEETGLLLLTSFDSQDKSPLYCTSIDIDVEMWRKRICKNPSAFIDMCLEVNLCPHIWCLQEWWNWLTPTIGNRRFDTMFYVCCLPKVPKITLDQNELTAVKWYTPNEILKEAMTGNLFLPPPQFYEAARFLNFYHIQDLEKFAKQRECRGIEQCMGAIFSATDGTVIFYPGDDLYPEKCDPKALFKHSKYPHTLSYLRNSTHNLNRLEMSGQIPKVYCNITPPCGHVQPLPHPPESHRVHSQL